MVQTPEKETFYKNQKTTNPINSRESVITMGDFNGRMVNNRIPGIKNRYKKMVN